jgi:hypothetical protein
MPQKAIIDAEADASIEQPLKLSLTPLRLNR